jgi:glycosyltransferase involved in cell wall biosynthesis
LGNWSDKIEPEHQKQLKIVQFHYLSATRNPYLPWLWATFINNIARKAYPFFSKNLAVNAFSSDKRAFQLHSMLKKLNGKYDLVMAHNLGALYPAWSYSKKHNIPFIFDIEDYHPGEKYGGDSDHERKRRERMMKNLLPEAALVTYASPLIGVYSLKLVGEGKVKKNLLINNSFHSSEFKTKDGGLSASGFELSAKLKLVWFSQNIDQGRGLEDILPLLDAFKSHIELHLIGNVRNSYKTEYLEDRDYIRLHGTMQQAELHALLSSFDVGLALENKTQDFNRDICLTNKIWAYFQSGLYILATDTQAQRQFLSEKPWAGEVLPSNETSIKERMAWLIENRDKIRKQAEDRYKKAKDFAWEKEGERLHKEIKQILNA